MARASHSCDYGRSASNPPRHRYRNYVSIYKVLRWWSYEMLYRRIHL
jgi:hypothetical protein